MGGYAKNKGLGAKRKIRNTREEVRRREIVLNQDADYIQLRLTVQGLVEWREAQEERNRERDRRDRERDLQLRRLERMVESLSQRMDGFLEKYDQVAAAGASGSGS